VVRIKICGVTTVDDALFAAKCGVEAVGLNFYSLSPRCISISQAGEIYRELPPQTCTVGVFVDKTIDSVRLTARTVHLHGIQTYDLPAEADFVPWMYIPAFRVKSTADLDRIQSYVKRAVAHKHTLSAVLIDSFVPGEMGGTGHKAPWELLAGFDPGVPVILAGGLTPENVADAIRLVRPWGVDVASGVESSPGKKDLGKMKAFVQAVRSVAVESASTSDLFGCGLHDPF